ncbi:MAG: hypothetical protein J2P59_04955 [Acidimicrobiales bacterium]|nr:hypothetical protein [Acidimicrobiales bacterium]
MAMAGGGSFINIRRAMRPAGPGEQQAEAGARPLWATRRRAASRLALKPSAWQGLIAGLATIGLAVVLVTGAPGPWLATWAYLLCLASLALWVLLRAVPWPAVERGAGAFEAVARTKVVAPDERPAHLRRMEGLVYFSHINVTDLHYRMRPTLRQLLSENLANHGTTLDGDPRVKDRLGRDGWELLRPDRREPLNRTARGVELPLLRRIVEYIEEL